VSCARTPPQPQPLVVPRLLPRPLLPVHCSGYRAPSLLPQQKHHRSGKISSSDFRVIQDKASNKVFETLNEGSAAHSHGGHDGRRDLLGSKRREKISHLVEQYVQKVAGQRSTEGAAAGGASAGLGAGLPPPPPLPPMPH
jgi:hypothetical protein